MEVLEDYNGPSNTPGVDTSELRLQTLSSRDPRATKTPPTSRNVFHPESKVAANEPNLESLSPDDPQVTKKSYRRSDGSLHENEDSQQATPLLNISDALL